MNPKTHYLELSEEAAEMNQEFVTRLSRVGYNYEYVTDKSKGYTKPQVFNSAVPSTYTEKYSFKRPSVRDDLIGLIYVLFAIGCAYLIAAGFSG